MPVIFQILSAIVAANLIWWRWADHRLQPLKSARLWRAVLAGFVLAQFLYLAVLASPRSAHAVQHWIPVQFVAGTYLWNLLVLPASLIVIGLGKLPRSSGR